MQILWVQARYKTSVIHHSIKFLYKKLTEKIIMNKVTQMKSIAQQSWIVHLRRTKGFAQELFATE